jgi:curved DNA-binding protein CbpA
LEDYYDLLGVSREATSDEIRAAYRRLAKRYHPDVNPDPDASERFIAVRQAYETLIDPEARARYDLALQGGSGSAPHDQFRYRAAAGEGFSWRCRMPESGAGRIGFMVFLVFWGVLFGLLLVLSFFSRAVLGFRRRQAS